MDIVKKINAIFRTIEETSAKTGKEAVLKAHKGDKEVLEALDFLLNPYIVTGISTKKINKDLSNLEVKGFISDFQGIINHLKKNNSGRDGDIKLIQNYISHLDSEELQDFVRKFVTKTLKLGISEKTVNKIYGADTIPTFAVMLAESYAKKSDKITGEFYITLKLDGNRCVAIVDNGVKFFTRKGQAIEGMTDLENQFVKLPTGVYDGELLLENKDNLPSADLFRATQKVVRKDGEKKGLQFHIFDNLTLDEFKKGKSTRIYSQRRNYLDVVINSVVVYSNDIFVLPIMYHGSDKSVIPAFASAVEAKGFEGIMINTADGLYQNKRVVDLQKVKSMKTADLLVMSIDKAIDGQFEGLLGRINVEYKGNLVGCGSGFTLEQRKYFIENPDEICGKIVEIQFFEESQDEKTGQPSLRFPVFKGIRDDKGVEDINYGE